MLRVLPLLAVFTLIPLGCSRSAGTEESTEATGDKQAQASRAADDRQNKAAESNEPAPLKRTSMRGNWVLYLTSARQGAELPYGLFEITAADDEKALQARLLAVPEQPGIKDLKLVSTEITRDSANIVFELQDATHDFRGTLDGAEVPGNVMNEDGQVVAARLVATEDASLANHSEPRQLSGLEELAAAGQKFEQSQGKDTTGFRKFVEERAENPFSVAVCMTLVALAARDREASAEKIEALGDDCLRLAGRWGERMQQETRIRLASMLAAARYQPQLALDYLDQAEKDLADDSEAKTTWKTRIDSARRQAEIEHQRQRLAGATGEDQRQAAEELQKFREKSPFDALLIHALARYAKDQGRTDEAIHEFSLLTSLPWVGQQLAIEWQKLGVSHASPRETLEELWKQKHGSLDGLERHLDEVYEASLYRSLDEQPPKARAAGEGRRTVLCELFTGSECPPCIAADVALGGTARTYADSDVIVLQYHIHVPGPDPLTNQDTEARGFHYKVSGTPTLFIDGRPFPQELIGGYMPEAADVYSHVRRAVDERLAEKAPITIDLQATKNDHELTIATQVSEITGPTEDLRLRIVLAEEEVEFVGGNGIRRHEMVVRSMPTAPEGVAIKEGTFEFSTSVDLGDLKQQLSDGLAAYEENQGSEFPVKPLALENLHVVAFVQNDRTGEILQAARAAVPEPADATAGKPEPQPTQRKQAEANSAVAAPRP